MSDRILLVDDDPSFREVMHFNLQEEGWDCVTVKDGNAGLEAFRTEHFPVVVTDLKMPGLDGMGLLEKILKIEPETLVIVITAFGDMTTAVNAMKAGAYDFLPKPCGRDHIKLSLRRAFEHVRLRREVKELRGLGSDGKELIFRSRVMEKVISLADRVAPSSATVLIEGESGTGKELVARRIHRLSERALKPFVAINCGAIPRELLEDELFGHVKGAFTGAIQDRKGKFQLADGGTLFLDEIAELSTNLQVRLLRVLQEHFIDIIGKDEPVPVDVRIIAATNQNLDESVESGKFRQDLFYRLNVVPIRIPPLRDRVEDIIPLLKYFLKRHSGGGDWTIPQDIAARLEVMPWYGNIRELENISQRIPLLCTNQIVTGDLIPAPSGDEEQAHISALSVVLPKNGIPMHDIEKAIYLTALEMNGYNRSRTARFLDIPRHVLLYRIEKYGIPMKGRDDETN